MFQEILIPNVLNPEAIKQMLHDIELCEHKQVRFVVLKGSDNVFCNGLDIAWVANGDALDFNEDLQHYASFLKKLQAGKFISIALAKGVVAGGGMGIVCACDYVIADETSTFSLPEGLLGLIPGMILPSLLSRLSPVLIKKMVFTGKKIGVHDALKFGIVDELNNDIQKALLDAINSMRSCKHDAVGDLKHILYGHYLNNEGLSIEGMRNLSQKLKDPDILQRLKDIADML